MNTQLDELNMNYDHVDILNEGLDIHVIPQKISVDRTASQWLFQMLIRCIGLLFLIPGIMQIFRTFPDKGWQAGIFLILLSFVPTLILWTVKNSTRSYFESLQQSINQAASQIDIYIMNRVTLMKSLAKTVDKELEQELKVLLGTAKERSYGDKDKERNYTTDALNKFSAIVEAYPDIKSNRSIEEMMAKDEKCMSEITAARILYNDKVGIWNSEIFQWPIKQIVAAENRYNTRISFVISASVKAANEKSDFWDK